jgi:hypothetical protein
MPYTSPVHHTGVGRAASLTGLSRHVFPDAAVCVPAKLLAATLAVQNAHRSRTAASSIHNRILDHLKRLLACLLGPNGVCPDSHQAPAVHNCKGLSSLERAHAHLNTLNDSRDGVHRRHASSRGRHRCHGCPRGGCQTQPHVIPKSAAYRGKQMARSVAHHRIGIYLLYNEQVDRTQSGRLSGARAARPHRRATALSMNIRHPSQRPP